MYIPIMFVVFTRAIAVPLKVLLLSEALNSRSTAMLEVDNLVQAIKTTLELVCLTLLYDILHSHKCVSFGWFILLLFEYLKDTVQCL